MIIYIYATYHLVREPGNSIDKGVTFHVYPQFFWTKMMHSVFILFMWIASLIHNFLYICKHPCWTWRDVLEVEEMEVKDNHTNLEGHIENRMDIIR